MAYESSNPIYGTMAVPAPTAARGVQPLTDAQYKLLMEQTNKCNWKVTDTEMAQAICTHKDIRTGLAKLKPLNEAGSRVRCLVCGKEFTIRECDMEEINNAVEFMTDVLQTIKLSYLDAPESLAKNFMQILPLLEKVPQLYTVAHENLDQHGGNLGQQNVATGYVGNNVGNSAFGIMNAAMAMPNTYYNGYGYQQPMYQQPMQAQPQQPMVNNGNPFAYYQPQQPMQPQAPTMPIPPAQPSQPQQVQPAAQPQCNDGTVTQNKSFSV